MRKSANSRRNFLATAGLAAGAAARPLSAYGQAVDNARQASRPSALQITELKCGYVRGSMFVKIHTNQGIWGCGEAVDAVGGTYTSCRPGQRIRGQNPLNVHWLFEQLRKGGVFCGAQAGMFVAVLTAVETALWDLAGKALNFRCTSCSAASSATRSVCISTPRSTSRAAAGAFASGRGKAVKDGYTAMKFDLDEATDPNKYDRVNWTASPAECSAWWTSCRRRGRPSGPRSISAPICTPATTSPRRSRSPNAWSRST